MLLTELIFSHLSAGISFVDNLQLHVAEKRKTKNERAEIHKKRFFRANLA